MSNGIEIPIKLDGATVAKLALDQIVDGFKGVERATINAAEKSATTSAAFKDLRERFIAGAVSADQMREALAGIAAQAPKVATEAKHAAVETGKSFKDALANVKDAGLHELSQKAGELGGQIKGVGGDIVQVAIKSAAAFGPWGVAITGVGAALAFATQAIREEAAAVALSTAQTEEAQRAAQNLGDTYPSMTAAIASATTAQEAHAHALEETQRLLAAQVALMNAAFSAAEARAFTEQMQRTAGAARELGTFMHGANEELIKSAIESGSAATQQELLGFSFTHSADAQQEHTNRVNAGIVASQRAAEAVAQHKAGLVAQAQVALETARADLAATGATENDAAAREDALRRVQDATEALASAQDRALVAQRNATQGTVEATAALDALESATRAQQEATDHAALQRGYAAITRILHERAERAKSHGHEVDHERERLTAIKQKNDREEESIRNQESALRRLWREEDEHARAAERAVVDRMIAEQAAIESARVASSEAYGEALSHAHELASIQARIAYLGSVSGASSETRAARARMAGQRAEGVIGHSAEMDDLRDPATQRERIDEMRRARELTRERTHLQRRYEMQRGFVERMEDLNDREVDGADALATSLTAAFKTTGDALADHLQKFADGRETAAEASQNMLADTLKNIGKESLVKAGFYFAEGLGNLATFNFPGAATAFAASAAFAAVGGGLIAGGNELTDTNTLGARKDAAAKSESRASGESAGRVSGSRGGTGSGAGAVYNINFGGPMYGTGGVRRAAREIVGVVNRGGIQGGVQILPGALLGGGAGS